jgi:hypothetical protein
MEKGAGGSANCREDRRPHKYTINIKRLRGDTESARQERGDIESENGATLATSTGRLSRPMNHPNKPSNETSVDFDLFWKQYPIKVGKQAAFKVWQRIIKSEKPDVIIQGATRYATDPNRHPSFTAHASTWLNAGRWNDAPLPQRVFTSEEKRIVDLQVAKVKSEIERLEGQRWLEDLEKQKAQAVPMPENLKQILRKTKTP